MRKCVLSLLVLSLALSLHSCGNGSAGSSSEAPELLQAVPSDALCIGIFNRLDKALDEMTDSASVLRSLDYGRLDRSRSIIALCDVGSLAPLVIIEAGKASEDTLSAAASVLAQADSFAVAHAYIRLPHHNALLLSPSETVLTIASRHLESGISVLDAPDFDQVAAALPSGDVTIWRNRGARKLLAGAFTGGLAQLAVPFIRDASEWMTVSDNTLVTFAPDAEKYFSNFCSSLQEAPSKLASVLPAGYTFYVDIPVASVASYRHAYETWLDARVALESYNRALTSVWHSSGKDPRAWESEAGVQEVAMVSTPEGRLNMVRVKDKAKSSGVRVNPRTGFVRALYGQVFADADSCMLQTGNWIISGQRAALEAFEAAAAPAAWPAKAKALAGTGDLRLVWNKDNKIDIWHSNR